MLNTRCNSCIIVRCLITKPHAFHPWFLKLHRVLYVSLHTGSFHTYHLLGRSFFTSCLLLSTVPLSSDKRELLGACRLCITTLFARCLLIVYTTLSSVIARILTGATCLRITLSTLVFLFSFLPFNRLVLTALTHGNSCFRKKEEEIILQSLQ